jgi:hypothetical protein
MAGLVPDARIRIYPDAAHGFLFQYRPRSGPRSTRSWLVMRLDHVVKGAPLFST